MSLHETDSELIQRAVSATISDRRNVADVLIGHLVNDRSDEDLFTIFCGIAGYGRNCVTWLNDNAVPAPPGSDAWTLDHLRPLRDCQQSALRFAEDFITAYYEHDLHKSLDLFTAMLRAADTHVVVTIGALIADAAHIAHTAVSYDVQAGGRTT